MARSRTAALVTLAMVGIGAASCANALDAGTDDPKSDAGVIAPPDSSLPTDPNAFRPLCASSKCPAPYGTCPNDRFHCETNFDSDDDNCGTCGVQCPNGITTREIFGAEWFCQSGQCRMACDAESRRGDCNGDVVDGCEADLACDPNNCGACGVRCPSGVECLLGQCGCPSGLAACGQGCMKQCSNLREDDANCGVCGNVCTDGPRDLSTLPPNVRIGCGDAVCAKRKCVGKFLDCNEDILLDTGDGCEIDSDTDPKNCGGCGKACAPGQTCSFGTCRCAPTETRCGEGPRTQCTDLDSDPENCGACNFRCPFVMGDSGESVCRLGHCEVACKTGFADCDGRLDNGCETPIGADPRNCGGCGITCDRELGQPCVNGACNRAPCDEEPAR